MKKLFGLLFITLLCLCAMIACSPSDRNSDDDDNGGGKTENTTQASESTTESAHKHTVVTDHAVPATCISAGKTEGSHCSVCNEVITAQTEIPATGIHDYDLNYKCTLCGDTVIASTGLKFTLAADGKSYILSGIGTCTDKDVIIPKGYNGLPVTSIGNSAFIYRTSLTSITIPDSVTSIGDAAFWDCESLTSITIPDSVTSIGDEAFRNCSSLTSVTIGNSVTSIGDEAFQSCTSLTNITFNGTMAQWKNIEKAKAWNKYTGNYTVTCTDGVLDKNGNKIS